MLYYSVYLFGISGLAFWSYSKFYNKNLNTIRIRFKNILRSVYILPRIYTPPDDIIYYKNNKVTASSALLKLIMGYSYRGEYDFVTYEIMNESGEKIYRIFDSQTDILNEFGKTRRIDCNPSERRIISALLIINRNITEELYDVTPKGLGVELEGNKLYSYNFIKYFFDINPGINYRVKLIDDNMNEIMLINNSQHKQVICIKSDGLYIEDTIVPVSEYKSPPERLLNKIKNRIYCFFYSKEWTNKYK